MSTCTPLRTMTTDVSITPDKSNTVPAEQNICVPLFIFVPGRELDCLTNSCVKLHIFDCTQELLNISHHKIALIDDEDTVTLVEESTLTTLDIYLSNNSDSSAGMHP
jgi:hypothetical protein